VSAGRHQQRNGAGLAPRPSQTINSRAFGSSAGMPWRSFGSSVHALPAGFLALVLLVEPLFERRKVVEDGGGIHLALAADGFQRVRPRLALAHAEHLVQALTGGFVSVDGAAMQRALDSGGL